MFRINSLILHPLYSTLSRGFFTPPFISKPVVLMPVCTVPPIRHYSIFSSSHEPRSAMTADQLLGGKVNPLEEDYPKRKEKIMPNLLEEANKKWDENNLLGAVKLFDKIISLFSQKEVKDIPAKVREELANIYYKKAIVFKMGREGDELIALDSVNKALELYPNFLDAINLKNGILAEYDMPVAPKKAILKSPKL